MPNISFDFFCSNTILQKKLCYIEDRKTNRSSAQKTKSSSMKKEKSNKGNHHGSDLNRSCLILGSNRDIGQ